MKTLLINLLVLAFLFSGCSTECDECNNDSDCDPSDVCILFKDGHKHCSFPVPLHEKIYCKS